MMAWLFLASIRWHGGLGILVRPFSVAIAFFRSDTCCMNLSIALFGLNGALGDFAAQLGTCIGGIRFRHLLQAENPICSIDVGAHPLAQAATRSGRALKVCRSQLCH